MLQARALVLLQVPTERAQATKRQAGSPGSPGNERRYPCNGAPRCPRETKRGDQGPHVWIWLLRLVPAVGSLTGMRMYSLLLAITTLLRPESTVPTSSAVNSANSWKPAGYKGHKRVTKTALWKVAPGGRAAE